MFTSYYSMKRTIDLSNILSKNFKSGKKLIILKAKPSSVGNTKVQKIDYSNFLKIDFNNFLHQLGRDCTDWTLLSNLEKLQLVIKTFQASKASYKV